MRLGRLQIGLSMDSAIYEPLSRDHLHDQGVLQALTREEEICWLKQ